MARRVGSLVVLGLVAAGGLYAWSEGWFERGMDLPGMLSPAPPVAAPDPAAVAAAEQREAAAAEQAYRRSVLVAIRAVEQTRDRRTRCLDMPDPPGTAWPEGAAAARCAMLAKPVLTLAVMRELLNRGSATALARVHADLLAAQFDDPPRRDALFGEYGQFDGSDAAAAVVRAWLRAAPRDPFAQAAAGWQAVEEAQRARGSAFAAQTSPDQFAAMQAAAARAWPLLDAALAAEPKLLPACVAAARLARLTGDRSRREQAQKHCESIDPASYPVLFEAGQAAFPRWGGSLPELEAVSARARAGMDRNPALATLAALAPIAIAEDAAPAEAVARWNEALQPGPLPAYAFRAAAEASARDGQDPLGALLLRSQAMRFDPCGDACDRRERLRLIEAVHDWDWLQAEAQALLAADPLDIDLLRTLWRARERRALELGGSPPPQAVLDGQNVAAQWLLEVEQCLVRLDTLQKASAAAREIARDEARDCSAKLVELRPDNPYAWYVQRRLLRATGQNGAGVALARMVATVDRTKPEQNALLELARGE